MPTYTHHYQTVMKEQSLLLLNDLTTREINSSAAHSMSNSKLKEIEDILPLFSLVETTSWLNHVNQTGCPRCASFFDRVLIPANLPNKLFSVLDE